MTVSKRYFLVIIPVMYFDIQFIHAHYSAKDISNTVAGQKLFRKTNNYKNNSNLDKPRAKINYANNKESLTHQTTISNLDINYFQQQRQFIIEN